ncbi:glycoside hydrolase family 92 protein [Chitinophaga lutea]|uniref:Glycoside hydrolase family 92 protein n=1 Tax=Chitinophaga lutea TaxID=2488634 RepID=A0A3N4Q9T5_9BACT|nr:GH92 family glycosyl hydrolase [Chitinophaga lutea]RPE14311.1 glycoside hydrolase family 92 protein [Chitinophaga lutea]
MKHRLYRLLLLLTTVPPSVHAQRQPERPVDLVVPQMGTAHSRWFYFSSASVPFGMVSLFPDNNSLTDWEGGYRYNIDTIRCFSHIHEWQLSGLPVMPVAFTTEADLKGIFNNHASHFSHANEVVKPGYHKVTLSRYDIDAALTATNHAGFHRYTFKKSGHRGILFDLGGKLGGINMVRGGFQQTGPNRISGFIVNGPTIRKPKEYTVYFTAEFSRPMKRTLLWAEGSTRENSREWRGKDGKLLVAFDDAAGAVDMKVGLSFVSEAGAANNLRKEIGGWDFDATVRDAQNKWNALLSRIKVEGGTLVQRQRFYTDLSHAIQGRRIINDVDGRYTDCTGDTPRVRQLPLRSNGTPRFNMYNSDAFWGAQWTLNTLWPLVYPDITEEFCNSFLEYYKNGGLIPRGPAAGNYTYVMTGASTTPFFVSAWQKGIRGFDIGLAFEGLKKNHLPGGMMGKIGYEHKTSKGGGIEFYISHGYVPYPLSKTIYGMHQDGATITLENAYQDWTLAQLAKALQKTDDYAYFSKRAGNYKNIFNAEAGYFVPRDSAGRWQHPFDPLKSDKGFEEGNAAQYLWYVPHHLDSLFALLGGKEKAADRLNQQYEASAPSRFIGSWINYENQPSIQTAFIFNHAGKPWLTQYWVSRVIDSIYADISPEGGFIGDEDQGLMGSLSVLLKLGLFQTNGGTEANPKYELTGPLFSKATIYLDPKYYQSKTFTITAKNVSATNRYIKSASVNGEKLKQFFIRHDQINRGCELRYEMDNQPNYQLFEAAR